MSGSGIVGDLFGNAKDGGVSLKAFMGAMRDEWFETQTAFLGHVVFSELQIPEGVTDSMTFRAFL
eukprot:10773375-Alexandrium_andersonii.AAC.1